MIVLFASRDGFACATCNCGDQTLTASGLEKPYLNRVRLSLDERYGSLSSGQSDYLEQVTFLRSALSLSWSPWKRVTFLAVLPWMDIWSRVTAQPLQSIHGLGDLELSLRAVLFQERSFAPHHLLWGSVGLKTPTGYLVHDNGGYAYSDDDQPGTGSWDPLAGITYGWFSGDWLSAFVSTTGRYTTPGWHGYRRGSFFGASAALQVQPKSWFAFSIGADVSWTQADALSNHHAVPNTGGTVLYAAPAILFSPRTDLLIRAVVDAPVVTAMNGSQTAGTQASLSVAWDVH